MAAKIHGNMSTSEMIMTMSEGNPGAMMVAIGLLNEGTAGGVKLLMLDALGIRGSHLYMLNNDCCDRDPIKFSKTIDLLGAKAFTEEQIWKNLDRVRAIPFIDESITVEGVDIYSEEFTILHPKWIEWVTAQIKSFESRIAE